MEEIPISKFKARCLALLERVRRTRTPLRVTRFGKPIAEVVPASTPEAPKSWLGSLAGTGEVRGDIISPASSSRDWEALKR